MALVTRAECIPGFNELLNRRCCAVLYGVFEYLVHQLSEYKANLNLNFSFTPCISWPITWQIGDHSVDRQSAKIIFFKSCSLRFAHLKNKCYLLDSSGISPRYLF
jgi:hypothetical protein